MSPETEHFTAPSPAGRLFLGIPVTDDLRDVLRLHLQGQVLPGRAVPPANWHLTLAFLGNTDDEKRLRLRDELLAQPLGHPARVTFDRLGAFPRPARASVLWLGVSDGADALVTIHAHVRAAVRRAGFDVDVRPFHPHLTLSRIAPPRDVRHLVARAPPLSQSMTVDAVVLFRSHVGGGPARYEVLECFPLAPSA